MLGRRRRLVVLWLGLATILVTARGRPLQRNRRILNEPGDIPNKGNTTLPYDKRQQIIYLLSKDNQSNKRDKEPGRTVAMEKYAKELSPDGRVVIPNANKLLVSEDFHSGRYKEMAVNKGDGPPNAIYSDKTLGQTDRQDYAPQKQQEQQQQQQQRHHQQQQQQQQKQVNTVVNKSGSVQLVTESRPEKLVNRSTSDPQVNFKRTETYDMESYTQKHMPLTRKSDSKILNEESKKDRFVKPVGRFFDGELLPPAKPIEPNVFDIGQDDIVDSHRPHFREEYGPHSEIHRAMYLPEDRPVRRWEDRPIRRWRHRHAYYHHRPAPVLMSHRPSMYYMPMYAGRSNVQMAQLAPGQNAAPLGDPGEGQEYGRHPVMMQPLVPMVSAAAAQPGVPLVPSQPMLQSPFVQQPEDRSSLYTLPMANAPQQPPQQFIYPVLAVPSVQQPQPQLQLVQQPALEPGTRLAPLASHWADEPGHERSEVSEEGEPKPQEYDDEKSYDDTARDSRYDEEQYHGYNEDERMGERRYQDEEEERDAERERLYRERGYYENSEPRYDQDTRYVDNGDENASVRSPPSLPVPTAAEESNEDDDEEENESEENEHALQDSRDDPLPPEEGPPEVERDEASPSLNYHQREMQSREQPSVVRFPPFSPPSPQMDSPFAYPGRLSADTYSREQLLGPSVPLRERVLPRLMHAPPRMAPIESPNGEISEMSASEARFRERMRLELAAKDTIPRGFHSDLNDDGFKNVVLRLNGEPLENASELRSKIIDGRIVQGKGKIIKSKGPMRIRVTHKGKGRNRVKFIDIISPQKYSVQESRSKIGRAPNMNHNLKKSQINKTNGHGRFTSHLRTKNVTATTNISRNMKPHGN